MGLEEAKEILDKNRNLLEELGFTPLLTDHKKISRLSSLIKTSINSARDSIDYHKLSEKLERVSQLETAVRILIQAQNKLVEEN